MKSKTVQLAVTSAAILVVTALAPAAPVGNSNLGREYLVNTAMLSPLSVGAYYKGGERGIEWDRTGAELTMDTDKLVVYAGCDLTSWLTPFVTIGATSTDIGADTSADTELELGVGLHVGIIDQDLLDPGLLEDKLRVSANAYYTWNETSWYLQSVEWSEFSANLLVGVVNDIEGNKAFSPQGIALYVGPAYSSLIADDFSEKQELGFIAGVEVYCTKRVGIDVAAERFDETAFSAGVNIRF